MISISMFFVNWSQSNKHTQGSSTLVVAWGSVTRFAIGVWWWWLCDAEAPVQTEHKWGKSSRSFHSHDSCERKFESGSTPSNSVTWVCRHHKYNNKDQECPGGQTLQSQEGRGAQRAFLLPNQPPGRERSEPLPPPGQPAPSPTTQSTSGKQKANTNQQSLKG